MENDPKLEQLRSIRIHEFSYLVRFNLRLYYPVGEASPNWLLELWLCKKDKQTGKEFDIDPHSLHIVCYGVAFTKTHYLTSLVGPLFLKIESIKDRQWQDLKYEVIDLEEGSMFYCKSFDVTIEEVAIEWI